MTSGTSEKSFVAIAALLGAIVGGSFTLGGQIIQSQYSEAAEGKKLDAEYERERVRTNLEAARQHYDADTKRILGTNSTCLVR